MGSQAKASSSLSAVILAKPRVRGRVRGNRSGFGLHEQADSLPLPSRVVSGQRDGDG